MVGKRLVLLNRRRVLGIAGRCMTRRCARTNRPLISGKFILRLLTIAGYMTGKQRSILGDLSATR